jgi:hypothetical protein
MPFQIIFKCEIEINIVQMDLTNEWVGVYTEQAYNNGPNSEEYFGFTELMQWDDGKSCIIRSFTENKVTQTIKHKHVVATRLWDKWPCSRGSIPSRSSKLFSSPYLP